MSSNSPILMWFRRDLRLSDHPALSAASKSGRPVIPIFILDPLARSLGAAPKFRLGLGVDRLANRLKAQGSRLILRSGDARDVIEQLIKETGAGTVYWSRLYDPDSVARDTGIKATLKARGIEAQSYGGHLMFEPWTVQTKTDGYYKVFTPFWKAVKQREVESPLPAPSRLAAPDVWPDSEALSDWHLGVAMNRAADILRGHARVGEDAALARLGQFIEESVGRYAERRDIPGVDGTSGLSENLSLGEISPHRCWHAGLRARHEGKPGAETFLKELVWREFAYHLMHHTPRILTANWREEWEAFPWETDPGHPHAVAWKQARTGIEFVDAAMREMYVTGRMHNRGRMIVASFLTKHLMCHWKTGMAWFQDCLTDWDPASNAMGWQWAAGSGPDASPYFRVFNPATQLDKFDRDRSYVRRWIAEGQGDPPEDALAYFDAIPRRWALSHDDGYPSPIVALDDGRKLALAAYQSRGF
ncbi:cryptochrome/photolyase family protein [Sedimentitalea todarodis]|uniref:Deoxyribodipyrimidine photo-lyase n=1 Tax=Sedimentitalea todarodis TaxID=1631240 RepID=A0ABU3VCE6_9RHOB|nr:deoxyribodipyrimidine photo-lyase [Sedimentitalea todarodis]MDU9003836.1 deoxyribodipyrimidine photo-lyase [Sedimentitalea todarodis]